MTYEEAKLSIQSAASFGSVFGLKSVEELLKRLGNPQNKLKFIHIAGTNGKGSTLAFLYAVLIESGYMVGRYCSPALLDYREVIQVNKEYIEKEAFARLFTLIKQASDSMLEDGLPHPTKFEMEAALAFLYFLEKNCDVVLLETGLGGLLDATNIVSTTIISIIASISKDHMFILGDTIEEITYQKAGIIKPNTDVVTFSQDDKIINILRKESENKNALLFIADTNKVELIASNYQRQIFNYQSLSKEYYSTIEISLAGLHQLDNAILAIETIERLQKHGFLITKEQLYQGFKNTYWFGRFSVLQVNPIIIVDGAHNQDATKRMRENLELYFKDKRKLFIIGIFKDKDYQSMIELTCDLSDYIVVVDNVLNDRLLRSNELVDIISKVNTHVVSSNSINDAYNKAIMNAKNDDVIVCFGSLSFLGDIKRLVEEGGNDDR